MESVVLLKVGTTEAVKSVNDLKDNIKELKKTLGTLEIGSEEYQNVLKELTVNQNALKDAMYATTGTMEDVVGSAKGLTGSYNSLVRQLADLKKEWRATNDEARRADLGGQIAELDAQLKELDASVGKFGRNVGNYVSHWEGMPDAVEGAAVAAKSFNEQMSEMREQTEPTKMKFESVANIASGLASGFAAVQGAAALLGIENEDLEKSLVKVQSAMAIASGIGGLGGMVEGIGKAKVAFQGLGDKVKAVSKAMGATGWIAVIIAVTTAIIALVSWIKKAKDNSEDLEKQLEKQNEMFSKMGSNVGNTVGKFKLLQSEYKNLKKEADKKKWIDANAQAFSSLGLAINDVNTANKAFLEDSDKIINALRLQAEAAALSSIYQEEFGKAYAEQRKIEQKALVYQKGYSPTASERAAAGLSNEGGDFNSTYHSGIIDEASWWQKGALADAASQGAQGIHSYTEYHSDVNEQGAAKLQEYAKKQIEAVWTEANAVLEDYVKKQKEVNTANKGLGGLTIGGTKTPEQLRDELVAKIWEDTYNELINMEIPDIPIEETKPTGYQYKDGDAQKRYGIRAGQIDRATSRAIAESKMNGGTEADEVAMVIAAEEKKLAALKEFWEQAKKEGDVTGMLELQQDIADQEVEIDRLKYEEKLRLDEEYKEKKIKISNQINEALSAAASVTQGILEITQAAYEKDGEISEKEAKKIKGLQIAIATMNMLAGITAALSGAFTTKSGPWDIALAAVQAATIAASGTANIMKIKNTDLTGSVPTGAMAAVTPNSNIFGTDLPMSYVRNVTTASETDELNKETRVVLVESDMVDALRKVEIRSSESTF